MSKGPASERSSTCGFLLLLFCRRLIGRSRRSSRPVAPLHCKGDSVLGVHSCHTGINHLLRPHVYTIVQPRISYSCRAERCHSLWTGIALSTTSSQLLATMSCCQ